MKTRISVPVSVEEREALRALAHFEMRDPREQMRYLLRRELVNRGILVDKINTGVDGLGTTTPVLVESTLN